MKEKTKLSGKRAGRTGRHTIGGAVLLLSATCLLYGFQAPRPGKKSFVNSLGMKMIYVPAGSFRMGARKDSFRLEKITDMSKDAPYWDELPLHKVTITRGFYMAETEVTAAQFRRFEKDYKPTSFFAPYASGISWDEATAFCKWLSKKEGKTYRLPTEAEWEYACRAGTDGMFWSGDKPPANDLNPWGLKNMESGVPEWCLDWLGPYPDSAVTDPVGYDHGWGKVVRGGALDTRDGEDEGDPFSPDTAAVFYRAANRSSLAPGYPVSGQQGSGHFTGFRVVMAPMPATKPATFRLGVAFQGIAQQPVELHAGPDSSKPYFKERPLISSPPDFTFPDENRAAGLNPAIVGKLHSGGLAVCPNGDLLYIAFSSSPGKSESAPNTTMVATRLRYGAREWDMPTLFYDLAGLNDQSALLWNDNGKLWFFGGGRHFGNIPFRYTTSEDNGASWSELTFPVVTGKTGAYAPQPITSAFRGPDGTIYFGCDGDGSRSLLWASKDNGKTWFDPGGRTAGRHTTFALLPSGKILGLGGKNSNIDGYMPEVYSDDFGKTWSKPVKSPFPALGSNQRPVLLKLQDGKLFYAGDLQNLKMYQQHPPAGVTMRGACVALSSDNGKTWKIKKLPLVPPHNGWKGIVNQGKPQEGYGTLGYCTAAQEPNGIIHLVSSKSFPAMDYAMNEAWIRSDYGSQVWQDPGKAAPAEIRHFEEKYPDGRTRISYSGWISHDGSFLLEGKETWYYPNGQTEYEADYHNGHKKGTETFRNADGTLKWTKDHTIYGTTIFTCYWHNGQKKSQSTWWGVLAHGPTTDWDQQGHVTGKMMFYLGRRKN